MATYDEIRTRLLDRWTSASKHTTVDILALGHLAHVAIQAKLKGVADAGARRTARAETIKDLRSGLSDAGCDRANELVRWVACWAVADVFGADQAKGMSAAALRAFIPLVRRDSKRETWAARKTFQSFARQLWETAPTMKAKELNTTIRERVSGNRKPRQVKPRTADIQKIVKDIGLLTEAQQRQLLAALQKKLNNAQIAAQVAQQPAPPAMPTVSANAAPIVHAAHAATPPSYQDYDAGRTAAAPIPDRQGILGGLFGSRKAG